jgi:hypothetical protein
MAIIRNPLQCLSCGTKTITRTAPGISAIQEYKFPCPRCGIEVQFALIRTKRAKSGYSFRKPVNAKWITSERGATEILNFDSFRVSPKEMKDVFSPFIAAAFKLSSRAYQAYAKEEGMRRVWIEEQWPWIQRLIVHFEHRNKRLFDKEAKLKEGSPHAATWGTRIRLFHQLIERAANFFTLTKRVEQQRVQQRLALADAIPGNLYDQLVQLYTSTSRMTKIWQELNTIRSTFNANYVSLSPLLRMQYWSEPPKNLADYTVPEKKFDVLKPLYVDCFETLCRLTVIVIAVEAIIHHKLLHTPTKRGQMSLWDLEALPNGNKPPHLSRCPV